MSVLDVAAGTAHLSRAQIAMETAMLEVCSIETRDVEVNFQPWTRMSSAPPEVESYLEQNLREKIAGGLLPV